MKAVISVIGKDKEGIIAKVSGVLFQYNINIEDISQTIMQEYFVMIMLVDMRKCGQTIAAINDKLNEEGARLGVQIRVQHEDIFNAMHVI